MKLIVGLGNPGQNYAHTRHNIGARVVRQFGAEHGIHLDSQKYDGHFGRGRLSGSRPNSAACPSRESVLELAILEPTTYMNRSGEAVSEALRWLPIDDVARDLLVVFDDVDLPFGRLRIRPAGSSAGHRGIASVIACTGRSDFSRLRFGVGRPEGPLETADWVLRAFSKDEEDALRRLIPLAAEAIEAILVDGVTAAMNRYNRDIDPEE